MTGAETAMLRRDDVGEAKRWRFPQGSLPKTAFHAYLDEKSTEL
jgi:hypothetical protein